MGSENNALRIQAAATRRLARFPAVAVVVVVLVMVVVSVLGKHKSGRIIALL